MAANHHAEQTVSPPGLYPAGDCCQCATVLWLQKSSDAAANINHRCPALGHAVCPAVIFSLLDVIFNLSQKLSAASQLPLKGIFQGVKLVAQILVGILIISLLLGQSPAILISGLQGDGGINAGI